MIPIVTEYGAVTVVIPGGNVPRYGAFEMALARLQVPTDSSLGRARSASVAKNRNEVIRASDTPWYFFLDDDQDFEEALLLRLLAHRQPVVSALIVAKMPPFFPIVFKGERINQDTHKKQWEIYTWPELDGRFGLLPVYGVGTGALLVTRDVLRVVKAPWFEIGRYDSEELNEDLNFSEKVRAAGIPMYVDLDTLVGHWDACAVWPMRLPDGGWSVRLKWDNGETVMMGRSDKPGATPAVRVLPGR